MKIILANPRGFCAGVERAIAIVERALEQLGAPIYVKHEVVHNKYVVDNLRQRGAIFVEDISEVPQDATVIFSAHGVSQQVREDAKARNLNVYDATCPLVTKVHVQVARYSREAYDCVLIGHAGHPEVEGTMGQYRNEGGHIYLIETLEDVEKLVVEHPDQLTYTTQTTLSVDDTIEIIAALSKKFPNIKGPRNDDICYATQNRQDAIKDLAEQADVIFVVGSVNSSNSNRLRELAERMGCTAYLIDSANEIEASSVASAQVVGVTAGASAPEVLVKQVISRLQEFGGELVGETKGKEETITFALPKGLR